MAPKFVKPIASLMLTQKQSSPTLGKKNNLLGLIGRIYVGDQTGTF